ncbi:8-amino-7-oxononanoate synthase [Methylophaga sp. 42_25_T18]|nr:8-amino-7-oxononanoate synthase [Methylophaga sp. 42_25_T18]OUR89213.1 8-amino-7-oxononanoate synthase [Methylophaga sp. 42_8_T64]
MTSLPWNDELNAALVERKAVGRYRFSRTRTGAQGTNIVVDDKSVLSFCSNDYLGLAANEEITQAFVRAAETEGVGSGAAHLLTGHSQYHHELELALADFLGQQRVLLFSTGYMANLAVIDGLLQRGDTVIQDKLNHASLLDGGRISAAEQLRYPHLDMASLSRRLESAATAEHKLIVSDGVFSMDGDLAPLPELMTLSQQHNAGLFIDDAHGLGVLGKTGRGLTEHFQIADDEQPIVMGTFGKAFGTAGAFIAADEVVIETLVQQARSYVYTTAQPAAVAAATLASLKIVQEQSWRREKLQALIAQFRLGAKQLGLTLMESFTPIQPVIIGDDQQALKIGQALEKQNILVGVIRPPTVPKNSARLRITLSAEHSETQVNQLLAALESVSAH